MARLLGMGDADADALYSLANPRSAYNRSIAEADGVWCTDWNAFGATDRSGIEADAYGAPLEVHDPALFEGGYDGASERVGLAGCSVGVTE
ncbi:MAG: hypothetical protein AB7S26_22200 [Sandaracinaceae bacterium]